MNTKRTQVLFSCFLLLASCFLLPDSLFAKPERIEIESKSVKAKKTHAKALAKSVDLSRVEDPEVRTALQAIFNALNLETKK